MAPATRRSTRTQATRGSTATPAQSNPVPSESSDGEPDIFAEKPPKHYSPINDPTLYRTSLRSVHQLRTTLVYPNGDRSAKRLLQHSDRPKVKRQRTNPVTRGRGWPMVERKRQTLQAQEITERGDPYSLDAVGEDDQDENEGSAYQDEDGDSTDPDDGMMVVLETAASKDSTGFVPDPYNPRDSREGTSSPLVQSAGSAESSPQTQPGSSSRIEKEKWDDPAFFDPPEEQDVPLAPVQSRALGFLLDYMGTPQWTREGKMWQTELCSGEQLPGPKLKRLRMKNNMSREDPGQVLWYKKHSGHAKGYYSKRMLRYIYSLWRLCCQVPTAANPEEQANYLRQMETVVALRQTVYSIAVSVQDMTTRFATLRADSDQGQQGLAERTAQSLRRIVIPFLFLVLKEMFILGSSRSREERLEKEADSLPGEGKFSASLLQTMLQITGWIGILHGDVMKELRQPPETNEKVAMLSRLALPKKYLEHFQSDVRSAWEKLGEEANHEADVQLAIENDNRLRQQREEKKRQLREQGDRQMMLHEMSRRRTANSRPLVDPSTLHQPALVTPNSSQTRHLSPEKEYAAKNDGWYYHEDDQLLTAIRRVPHPDFAVLANVLRGRSAEDVRQRVGELKELSRRKFEAWKRVPPPWCTSG